MEGLRKELKEYTSNKSEKYAVDLEKIYAKNIANKEAKNDNLRKILSNEYFLANCFEKIKSNTGALTPGTDKETEDEITFDKVKNVALQIR